MYRPAVCKPSPPPPVEDDGPPPPICPPDHIVGYVDVDFFTPRPPFTHFQYYVAYDAFPTAPPLLYEDDGVNGVTWDVHIHLAAGLHKLTFGFNAVGIGPPFHCEKQLLPYDWCQHNDITIVNWDVMVPVFGEATARIIW